MEIEATSLPGVFVITPAQHRDGRGVFSETWSARAWAAAGMPEVTWAQDNRSVSTAPGTLRGLHYQAPPAAQAKLVRCGAGALFDVAVDARRGSAHYGQWVGVDLTPDNARQLFIPAGFLHGFVTRAPDTECLYKCSAPYAAGCDGAVHWQSLGIDWGVSTPVLSEKDAAAPPWESWESPFEVTS